MAQAASTGFIVPSIFAPAAHYDLAEENKTEYCGEEDIKETETTQQDL